METSVILIFIDGVGIGEPSDSNPLTALDGANVLRHFRERLSELPVGGRVVATDPRLGVPGRPQSASGQTTIITGVNAPALLGHHKQGYPNERLRHLIRDNSLFVQLHERGVGPLIFANAYTPQFFTSAPRWKSATTCAVEAAGIPKMTLTDLVSGKALFHDFTNSLLVERGHEVPLRTPAKAGKILASLSETHRLILFEHFMTDKIGHDRDRDRAPKHLAQLSDFIVSCVGGIDLERVTVIVTSDHGNIEDLSVRNHTLNDVPTLIWGRCSQTVASSIGDLSHIAPAIVNLLK